MPAQVSPLHAIKQKELDLRRQIDEARQRAEAAIAAARAEAEQTVQCADQAGKADAAEYYRKGIEQARQEANAITTAANDEAAALRCQAAARLDEVARQIVELVYAPFNGESPGHRDKTLSG